MHIWNKAEYVRKNLGPYAVAKWLLITTAHTVLHIGRIQLLRALIEGKRERAC